MHHHPEFPRLSETAAPTGGLPRRPWAMVAGLGLLAWLATGVYTVQPNEQVVVRRFGRALSGLRGPGLHVGLPAGLDRVDRLRMQELRRVAIGPALSARAIGRDAMLAPESLAGDRNLVRLTGAVQYQVDDPRAFLFVAADPNRLIGNLVAAALGSAVSGMDVDTLLTVGRVELQEQVREVTQRAAEAAGLGVRIAGVTLEDIGPPAEVAEAFRDVAAAKEDRQRTVNEAQGYANRVRPQARGEADRLLLAARGDAERVLARAGGEAAAFAVMAARLGDHREATLRRLSLEAAEAVLSRARKVLGAAGREIDVVIQPGWPR